MQSPCNPSRRRLLSISACAVAGFSASGSLLSTVRAANRSSGASALGDTDRCTSLSPTDCGVRELETHHFYDNALGAHISLAVVHFDRFVAEQIAKKAFAEIARLERIFSLYQPDSSVVKLNATGKLRHPPAELLSVFSQTSGIWRATEGAFDPTVQPYWDTRHDAVERRSAFSWQDIAYSTREITFAQPGMAITLNGIAQGYISEQIANLMRKHGLKDVLVNVGEIVAMGNNQAGEPWRVGLAELQDDSAQYKVNLTNTAIATSAPLSRLVGSEIPGGHIIDPATSRSCESPWTRLSVIHPSAAIADGLSTGLIMKSAPDIEKAISHYPQARVIAANNEGLQYEFPYSS